jgi:tRNA nucleotidyltransferase (CCA-adding enzyme)
MSLIEDLPNPQRRAIEIIRSVAAEKNCHPFLVGGPVRDMLLGRRSIDLDLTLQEGASTLARALARQVQGRVRSYPQFLTYKVVAPEFPEIDIATARSERYRQPGALPVVTAGKLKDDLLRRDFSINAIALDLTDGSMHDPTDGEQDIARRVVRVLHSRSFIDDPTRAFRAIRLAMRLGFSIEPETDRLMTAAIAEGAMSTVSKERLWRELFLAMDEQEAPAVLADLVQRGALDVLFGKRTAAGLRERLEALNTAIAGEKEADRHVLFTGLLLRGDASPVDFEGAGFSQKRARTVVEIANEIPRLAESLAGASDETARFAIYRRSSPDALLALVAEHPDEKQHLDRFRDFASFQLPLRGNDLEVPAGPHIAKALERTREAVFNGEIPVEDARSFARGEAKKLLEEKRG